jgi:hypothetical protein
LVCCKAELRGSEFGFRCRRPCSLVCAKGKDNALNCRLECLVFGVPTPEIRDDPGKHLPRFAALPLPTE